MFVHLMPNKCSCHDLDVVVTVFVLFFFLLQCRVFYVASLVALAHFPPFS